MKLRAALALALVFTVLPAAAKDVSDHTGIGVERSLGFTEPPGGFAGSGVSGQGVFPAFSFIFPTTDIFHFQIIGGLHFAAGANASPTFGVGAAFRGLYHGIPLSETVDLVAVFGVGYVFLLHDNFGTPETNHFINIETGLRPEWFITDFFSIHTQAGIVLSLLMGNNNAAGFDPGVGLSVFDSVNLVGDAGFTVWFD